ncbi:MAG: hypothetical protein AB1454_06125 [Candidatus Auribacterota bacterium]
MKTTGIVSAIALLGMFFNLPIASSEEKHTICGFESPCDGVYAKYPSYSYRSVTAKYAVSGKQSLMIEYKKDKEGFCGYYIHLKKDTFFNASKYSKLTFMVKGEKGGENFRVGLADEKLFMFDDAVPSNNVTNYLSNKSNHITAEWQKVEIPLKTYVDIRDGDFDVSKLAAVSIAFDSECFPDGTGEGVIYIDDLMFE